MSAVDYFAEIPPVDKYNLIGAWIATLIYGANVLLYGSSMVILIRRRSGSSGQRLLLSTSTLLFILATLHIGASLEQLIDAFIKAPRTGAPAATLLYWTDGTKAANKIKGYSYALLDTTQDLVLIWRLYIVWSSNWKIVVLPLLLEVGHTVASLYDSAKSTEPGIVLTIQSSINLIAWSFLSSVNFGTTCGIAGRLWYLGRTSQAMTWPAGPICDNYLVPIFTIIESGAIFSVSLIILLVMIIANSMKLLAMVNVSAQIAAFTPLLIIVRVGLGLTHSLGTFGSKKELVLQLTIPGESGMIAAADSVECSSQFIPYNRDRTLSCGE